MKIKEDKLRFRHELKFLISRSQRDSIKSQLASVMHLDENARNGIYQIRSLYFDDMWESAYQEKLQGIASRKKYRIRIYNYSDSIIKLERKRKEGQYINKVSANLSKQEVTQILDGDYQFLLDREEQLCKDFYIECITQVMRPRVIVDYEREPFVYEAGDVRVTFDSDVRSGFLGYNIFDETLPVINVLEPDELIMEVKFTEFLPNLVRAVLPTSDAALTAASKYVMCMEKRKEYMR